MNDYSERDEVRELWRAECRTLPLLAVVTAVVCVVVWWWRLDQSNSGAFIIGTLVGSLLTCVLASFTFIVRLGRAIRGGLKSGLLVDAFRLARGK